MIMRTIKKSLRKLNIWLLNNIYTPLGCILFSIETLLDVPVVKEDF